MRGLHMAEKEPTLNSETTYTAAQICYAANRMENLVKTFFEYAPPQIKHDWFEQINKGREEAWCEGAELPGHCKEPKGKGDAHEQLGNSHGVGNQMNRV